jgi:hypothetical protein
MERLKPPESPLLAGTVSEPVRGMGLAGSARRRPRTPFLPRPTDTAGSSLTPDRGNGAAVTGP